MLIYFKCRQQSGHEWKQKLTIRHLQIGGGASTSVQSGGAVRKVNPNFPNQNIRRCFKLVKSNSLFRFDKMVKESGGADDHVADSDTYVG